MAEANPGDNPDEKSDISSDSLATNDDILKQMCGDYAEYLKLDIKDETADFEESLEEMLTRLDEFCGLVDMIRSDTNLCLGRTLPSIYKKCLEMQNMFEKIDQLEVFVRVVVEDVAVMERHVEEAEAEMGTLSGIKRVFKSFSIPPFLSKKPAEHARPSGATSKPKYIPPDIFRTDMYLYSDPSRSSSAARHVTSRLSASSGSSEKHGASVSSNESSQSESRVGGGVTTSRNKDDVASSGDVTGHSQTRALPGGRKKTDISSKAPSDPVSSEGNIPDKPQTEPDSGMGAGVARNGTVVKEDAEGNVSVVQDNQTDNQKNNNEVIS